VARQQAHGANRKPTLVRSSAGWTDCNLDYNTPVSSIGLPSANCLIDYHMRLAKSSKSTCISHVYQSARFKNESLGWLTYLAQRRL
jgi:hypothetical protein